nr:PREDICTED: uncharacterized protein LOC109039644 isoform X3 [Bemisia tabaci]
MRRKAFMVEYFEKCENKDYPWEATNFSFVRDDTSLHMNGWVLVNRDIRDPISLQIKMDRCKDRTDLSSCEHVTSIKWPDLCGAVKLIPNFRIFFDALEPPLSCPVKKRQQIRQEKERAAVGGSEEGELRKFSREHFISSQTNVCAAHINPPRRWCGRYAGGRIENRKKSNGPFHLTYI